MMVLFLQITVYVLLKLYSVLVMSQSERFRLKPSSRVLLFATPSFDASVSEVIVTLSSGAAIVMIGSEGRSGKLLRNAILSQGITHVTLPPTALNGLDVNVPLHTVVVAGENISVKSKRGHFN